MPAAPRVVRRRPTGFTLTELMISVALVLVLTLGIGLIFRTTSRTIGAATNAATAVRGTDAVRTTLAADMTGGESIGSDALVDAAGILPNSEQVAIVISSMYVPTFLDEADADSDVTDWRAIQTLTNADTARNQWAAAAGTLDANADGDETDVGDVVSPLDYGRRTFRADLLSFGARGSFASQTGTGEGGAITPFQASNALMIYGHLRVFNSQYALQNSTNAYAAPADPIIAASVPALGGANSINSNNLFADQFVLGRFALLLSDFNAEKPPASATQPWFQTSFIKVPGGGIRPVAFLERTWLTATETGTADIAPFRVDTNARRFFDLNGNNVADASDVVDRITAFERAESQPPPPPNSPLALLNWGRYDVAAASAGDLRDRIEFVAATDPAELRAYSRAPFRRTAATGTRDQYDRKPAASDPLPAPLTGTVNGTPWWDAWFTTNNTRVWANPFGQQPFNARALGQRSHQLQSAVRQFVVEYAGDYLTQNATTGAITGVGPDGAIDFYIDSFGRYGTRFYGFPRDVDGDGDIALEPAAGLAGAYRSPDVLPLKDMVGFDTAGNLSFAATATPLPFPHEKMLPITARTLAYRSPAAPAAPLPAAYGAGTESRYVCAWGPDELDGAFVTDDHAPATVRFDFPLGPKLIRVVVEAGSPDGPLAEPIRSELVFRVPE